MLNGVKLKTINHHTSIIEGEVLKFVDKALPNSLSKIDDG